MSVTPVSKNNDKSQLVPEKKLMVSGFICPRSACVLSIEVRRGMVIRSKEGMEMGKVAAIVLDTNNQKATHLLLDRLPEISGYWLIDVNLVINVQDCEVDLSIPIAAIQSLPRWHST